MLQVGCEFMLQQGTLFLAVDLLDRFLSKAKVVELDLPTKSTAHLHVHAKACSRSLVAGYQWDTAVHCTFV